MNHFIPQEQYDFIIKHMPIACVDVCVVDDRGVLLVKRNTEPAKGEWWVPGGRVLKGEMLRDCATRKCSEEIGIACTIGPIVHTDETVFDTGPNGISVHSINVCFLAIPSKDKVYLDSYSDDFMWVTHIDPNYHPYVQKCLQGSGLK